MTCDTPSITVENEDCSILAAATFPLMCKSIDTAAGSIISACRGDDDDNDGGGGGDVGKIVSTERVIV